MRRIFTRRFSHFDRYLDMMKPHRDAIKAEDPSAIVAIFVRDPGNAGGQDPWDRAIAAYPN